VFDFFLQIRRRKIETNIREIIHNLDDELFPVLAKHNLMHEQQRIYQKL
jgi:hypothetical protein